MDEAFDSWYRPKVMNPYVKRFMDSYLSDTRLMVQDAYNPVSYTHLDVYKRQAPGEGDVLHHLAEHLCRCLELLVQRLHLCACG